VETPLQFDFINMARAQSLVTLARDQARALQRHCDCLTGCRVTLEAVNGRQQSGQEYQATVYLTVPGAELVSRRSQNKPQLTAQVAVRDAFHAIRRELLDHLQLPMAAIAAHSAAG
jgi:hypothetical protein